MARRPIDDLDPIEWAKLVNRTWIVHNNLNNSAQDWMDYLAGLNDGRLIPSCEIARAMCRVRDPLDDPKPWFYAGLFHLATAEEARRFLPNHRVTRATIPTMADDEDVLLWQDRITPETRALLDRLRAAIQQIGK
ncbi:MAG: hypothetical protein V4689_03475 [Verrucomicrobiota bacterium]